MPNRFLDIAGPIAIIAFTVGFLGSGAWLVVAAIIENWPAIWLAISTNIAWSIMWASILGLCVTFVVGACLA